MNFSIPFLFLPSWAWSGAAILSLLSAACFVVQVLFLHRAITQMLLKSKWHIQDTQA